MSLLIGTTAGAFLADDPAAPLIRGQRVNHIARDRGSWWAVDQAGRAHRDGEVVATMPEAVVPLCIMPTPETVWIGADGTRLYGIDHGRLEEDEFFAAAPGREAGGAPSGDPPGVGSMTLDADHTLYVSVRGGAVMRYDNTGVIPALGASAGACQVAAHPSRKGAVFAACAQGLAFTHNGHDFEIRSGGLHSPFCGAVAVLGDRVLLSASEGPSRARLYRGELWGGDFEPMGAGLPKWFDEAVGAHCIAVVDGAVYVGVGGAVWRSDDGGDSWSEVVGGLGDITCLA